MTQLEQTIADAKEALGVRDDKGVIALSPSTDPWLADSPKRRMRAIWFRDLWITMNFRHGIHLRRIHYVLISQETPVRMPLTDMQVAQLKAKSSKHDLVQDGDIFYVNYLNTLPCFIQLGEAARDARFLNLVPRTAFDDRRNDEPREYLQEPAEVELDFAEGTLFPTLDPKFTPIMPGWQLGDPPIIPQPSHLECWAEKTTMNDVLIPLCERKHVNLITGAGEASLTMVDKFIERVKRSGRPAIVLYISDFDPAGQSMPVTVARKAEFRVFEDEAAHDLDIKLFTLVLTKEQIRRYRLPPIPLKETERRADKFMEHHDIDGGVELDALEAALHPGVLEEIVTEAIEQYQDPHLEDSIKEAYQALEKQIEADDTAAAKPYQAKLKKLQAQYRQLATKFNKDLAPLNKQLKAIMDAVAEELEPNEPATDWPEPEVDEPDGEPLYDSSRDYVDQLAHYQRAGRIFKLPLPSLRRISFSRTIKSCCSSELTSTNFLPSERSSLAWSSSLARSRQLEPCGLSRMRRQYRAARMRSVLL